MESEYVYSRLEYFFKWVLFDLTYVTDLDVLLLMQISQQNN
jgi:hypothetical protein